MYAKACGSENISYSGSEERPAFLRLMIVLSATAVIVSVFFIM